MYLLGLVREYLFKYSVSWTVQVVTTSSFEKPASKEKWLYSQAR